MRSPLRRVAGVAGPLPTRRGVCVGLVLGAAYPVGGVTAIAQSVDAMEAAIKVLVGNAPVRSGRVSIDIPPLAENGNAVPITIGVESPMSAADHVISVHMFSERNPIAMIGAFHFTPKSGRARVQTNIRLATTQFVTVIARMSDGSFWSAKREVIVTLAACVDAG